jgi:multimeric flavodoxin WrbA
VNARFTPKTLYVSGSPRQGSNTDHLLEEIRAAVPGEFIKLSELTIEPCRACWACQTTEHCTIVDELSPVLARLCEVDVLVLGSPVYFNNVSSSMKAFIDRTWCLRGRLRNKIGGAVVVGRRDGIESALTALQAFFLKHDMIPANRGVSGLAFNAGDIVNDRVALGAAAALGERLIELSGLLQGHR